MVCLTACPSQLDSVEDLTTQSSLLLAGSIRILWPVSSLDMLSNRVLSLDRQLQHGGLRGLSGVAAGSLLHAYAGET